MAYTSFLVPSLKTSQHNLGGVYTNNRYGHSIASFAARKSILPGNVSELSRPLLRSINYLSKILCSKRRTALLIFMPLYIGAAHCHCETSLLGVLLPDRRYGHGGTTTRAPSRLAPRPHRLHTTNGGVCFVTHLWLSGVARCTQRAFFEATTGECDKLDATSCQYGMNGDALMNTFRTFYEPHEQRHLFPSLESNAKLAILSARAPLYRCDRQLSVPSS
ncbi:unnamed protein product [Penicillium salamii]|uniref:Uncharacterized protein n=1 Tax=Penicillium salamii TaxID=1612424 RepID=A0A9W4J6E6_9EURO|nr:unnamed protein product [Penicillium salamii]CAG8118097.1 unnamed protein product [Penicillium salamii]CAG8336933.1 unnamed protein product [Penicillium salamii]CAG8372251.1 unnamed protein product [Penicillium salamii]CAG8374973.1 unnamed protein product [Penicillium salamii]